MKSRKNEGFDWECFAFVCRIQKFGIATVCRPVICCIFLLFYGMFSFAQKKQVCFSFDDLPVVNYGISDTICLRNISDNLIHSLKSNHIPAIGFMNEQKLYDGQEKNSFQVSLLRNWVNGGLELGNHTYSHPDYNKVSFQYFSADLLKGETISREILARKGHKLIYFRHPFLHVGNTKAKADSLSDFLSRQGYRVAPVTIDNEDYIFALAYKRAKDKQDTLLVKQIGHDYLGYMERKLKYFENQARILFGREISQILLLHASNLNADYVDSLAVVFRNNDYDFVSIGKALEDKAYASPISVYGNWGISWIDKWALSMGKKGSFFREEPETPAYIKKLSE